MAASSITLDEIASAAAVDLRDAYFAECDKRGSAVDPAELTGEAWAAELLAEAYDTALKREAEPLG